MRVLYFTNLPSPYRVEFFGELGKYCDLTVAYERRKASDRDSRWISEKSSSYREIYLNVLSIGTDMSVGFDAVSLIRNKNYDVLCISGYSSPSMMIAISYCRRKKIPYILVSDGSFPGKDYFPKRQLKRYLIEAAKYYISPCKNSDTAFIQNGAEPLRIMFAPFSSLKKSDVLDTIPSKREKDAYKVKLGISNKKLVITVGRFIHGKGFDVLLRALKLMKQEASFVFIGGKPTDDYLAIQHNSGLRNVRFVDFQTKNALREYYLAADIFVFPTRQDAWGLVINEAMAYGLPIVSTDRSNAALSLVQDGINGFIVPVESPEAIAEKLDKILEDEEIGLLMGYESLKKIREYTIENMAVRYFDIFRNV